MDETEERYERMIGNRYELNESMRRIVLLRGMMGMRRVMIRMLGG